MKDANNTCLLMNDSCNDYLFADNNQDKEEDIDYELEYLDGCFEESLITPHVTKSKRCLSPEATIVNTPSEKVMPSIPSFTCKRRYCTRKDDEEKQLRIQKAKQALEQQRELHQLRIRTAETEANLAEIKLEQAMMEFQAATGEKCTS
ncbi:uncharacterized protein LOC107269158 [Cephus cinctus]|uniref:Uncharacterized protein LOC107269158 n=1 Tax=Cephus cinctus TaxID=211228 RepID=A0AAJ7FLU4_CEPCN|nr:uncharacterized protein LOC107269158 [Cephus cinctus]